MDDFLFPKFQLDKKEYWKVVHEINSLYYTKYYNKKYSLIRTLDTHGNYCIYYFEVRGFDDYNIVNKKYD